MMKYFLLACTLPGNIEKKVLTIKSDLFTQTGLPSALILPPLMPITWFREAPRPEDISLNFSIMDDRKKGREISHFTTDIPRIENDIWWLPVLPSPRGGFKNEILRPFPGIPLVADPAKGENSPSSYSSIGSSRQESTLQKTLHAVSPLSWKGMGLSCFEFWFPPSRKSQNNSGVDTGAVSLGRESDPSSKNLWNTRTFREEGVEWEEVWRYKKPVLPG